MTGVRGRVKAPEPELSNYRCPFERLGVRLRVRVRVRDRVRARVRVRNRALKRGCRRVRWLTPAVAALSARAFARITG